MYVHLNDCKSLRWRHNGRDGVSNHQPHDCLLNRLFRRRSKKTSKLRVTGLCAGNSPVTGEFPALRASNAGNVSIWWRHHASPRFRYIWWYTVHEIFTYMCTCTRRTDSYLLIQKDTNIVNLTASESLAASEVVNLWGKSVIIIQLVTATTFPCQGSKMLGIYLFIWLSLFNVCLSIMESQKAHKPCNYGYP